jgi:hypothetical protein
MKKREVVVVIVDGTLPRKKDIPLTPTTKHIARNNSLGGNPMP